MLSILKHEGSEILTILTTCYSATHLWKSSLYLPRTKKSDLPSDYLDGVSQVVPIVAF
jgi:hypothetical protein